MKKIFLFIFFYPIYLEINAQYFSYDSIPVNYEIVSIKKAKNVFLSNLRALKRNLNKEYKYHTSKKDIISYKNAIIYYKHSDISKNAYLILLKNIDNGNNYLIVTIKGNMEKGKRINVGNIYKLKLEKYFKNDLFINLGIPIEVEINKTKVLIHHNRWTGNIYITQNIKGLYYVGNVP